MTRSLQPSQIETLNFDAYSPESWRGNKVEAEKIIAQLKPAAEKDYALFNNLTVKNCALGVFQKSGR